MKTLNTLLIALGLSLLTLPGLPAEKPAIKLSLVTQKGEVLNFYSSQESEIEEPLINHIAQRARCIDIITPENLVPFIKPEKEIDDLDLNTEKIFSEIVLAK